GFWLPKSWSTPHDRPPVRDDTITESAAPDCGSYTAPVAKHVGSPMPGTQETLWKSLTLADGKRVQVSPPLLVTRTVPTPLTSSGPPTATHEAAERHEMSWSA